MKKYECTACGYIYDEALGDPDSGIAPGTKWEDIPDDWVCPLCGLGKDVFEEMAKQRRIPGSLIKNECETVLFNSLGAE